MDERETSQADAPASDSMGGGRTTDAGGHETGADASGGGTAGRTPCPDCMGTGSREGEDCITCGGTGVAPEESVGGG